MPRVSASDDRITLRRDHGAVRLAGELKRLDKVECIALHDIGYVQHDRTEMEVLFALLAGRYERKSVMITSDLAFSNEFLGPSLRSEVTEERARPASTIRHPAPRADA